MFVAATLGVARAGGGGGAGERAPFFAGSFDNGPPVNRSRQYSPDSPKRRKPPAPKVSTASRPIMSFLRDMDAPKRGTKWRGEVYATTV